MFNGWDEEEEGARGRVVVGRGRRVLLVTAEDPLTRDARARELIRFPQLTMPLLAALTPAQWDVRHVDEIVQEVGEEDVDVVGITAATPGAPHAYEIARRFRARGVTVVMGGPHATLMPREVAAHVDHVVVGEAERTWPALLRYVAEGVVPEAPVAVETLASGARVWRCEEPASLAGLPHARRDLIRNGGFNRWWATRGVMIATRGCPHVCTYCTIPLLYPQAQRMRFRPVEEVVAEVEAVQDKGVVFWDDNIAADPEYARRLFAALAPARKWWTSQTTMTAVRDDRLLELAAESGCKALFLGLESVNAGSLKGARKAHNRPEGYRELMRRFHEHGIAVQAGVMFGFDEDDRDTFKRTVDALGEAGLDNATISLLVPYPGTPVFARMEAEGRILDRDWRHYNGKTHVVFQPAQMSAEELLAGYEWAKQQFYSFGHIAKRLAISRTGLWWNIPRNVGYALGITGEVRARAAMHKA